MSTSAWGNVGAWAEESERADAEEREAASKDASSSPGFPSLKESITIAKQKKKKTKMSLQEFTMQHTTTYPGSSASSRLTSEEMISLPTGPKQRSADDMRSGRLVGGFSNYGTRIGSANYNTSRPREVESRRSYGDYEEDERKGISPISKASEFSQPSRADEVDNWASVKKPNVFQNVKPEIRPAGMYGSLSGDGGPGIQSRADEVDNWASLKALPLQKNQQDNSASFWSGTSSSERSRWASNSQSIGSVSPRPELDDWRKSEQNLVSYTSKNESQVVDKLVKTNPFGAARPREDVLFEKGLDRKKMNLEIDEKNRQSISLQSDRPRSSDSSRTGVSFPSTMVTEPIEMPKPRTNPFGDAKPREVLLEEKGLDWRKIDRDLERRGMYRTETDEENNLKEDIMNLRNELLEKVNLHDQLEQKERDLEELVQRLDDKLHYTQKTFDRPSSGSSRSSGLTERPPSAPGAYADRPPSQPGPHSRSGYHKDTTNIYPARYSDKGEPTHVYDNERIHSRDASNSWANPNDGRRSYEGGRRRGSSVNREANRSGSRW